MPASAKNWYRVTAPYVTAKTMTNDGVRVIGLYEGAPLPFDIPQDSLDHLVSHALVEEFTLTGPEASALAAARGGAPEEADPVVETPPDPAAVAEVEREKLAAKEAKGQDPDPAKVPGGVAVSSQAGVPVTKTTGKPPGRPPGGGRA